MSIASWMLIWKICLWAALGSFAVMSVVVTIGGGRDLRRLFRRLAQDQQREQ